MRITTTITNITQQQQLQQVLVGDSTATCDSTITGSNPSRAMQSRYTTLGKLFTPTDIAGHSGLAQYERTHIPITLPAAAFIMTAIVICSVGHGPLHPSCSA